ncbi:MAG: DUF4255 domain-containing protein [Bacteroidota bacterium]
MIGDLLDQIRVLLQNYFNDGSSDPNANQPDNVVLKNIAFIDAFNTRKSNIGDELIISLVGIEEEKTLRYAKTTTVFPATDGNPNNSTVVTHHPVIYLNTYLLFSANNTSGDRGYQVALNQISAVINFFQRQHIFTSSDMTLPADMDRVVFELCSLSFEQKNHLWGVLGGKYIPSVLYKARIFPHEDVRDTDGAGRILRERANSNVL